MSNPNLNIGLYVSNLADDSVYSLCSGASSAAKELGANLLIFPGMHLNGDYNDPLKSPYYYQYNTIYELGRKINLDFLIIMAGIIGNTLSDEETLKFIENFPGIPVMTVAAEYENYHSIRLDNKTGLKKALNHLIHRHNCRNIGFVSGSRLNSDAEERRNVYVETMLENGLAIDKNLIVYGDFSENSDNVVTELLNDNEQIDAICFANDEMAKGGYRVLEKSGKFKVGKNISVVGFDNSKTAVELYPLLTTVNADNYSMGYKAVSMIPELLTAKEPKHTVIPTNLIVRNSCGCKNTSYENLSYIFADTKLSKSQLAEFTPKDYMNYLFRDSSKLKIKKYFPGEKYDRIVQVFENFFEIVFDYGSFMKAKHYRKAVQNAVQEIIATGILSIMPTDEIYNIIDIVQYRLTTEYSCDYEIGLVFSQIYREIATFNHTSRRRELNYTVNSDTIINCIVNDVIITGEASKQSLRPIMTRLSALGIDQSYMYLFDAPAEHKEGTKFSHPETISLIYSQHGDVIHYFSENNRISPTDLLSDKHIDNSDGLPMIITPLFSNEEIYGILICSARPALYQYINKIGIQIGTALKYNSILRNLHSLLATEKENSRNLEKISKYDELTGIFNRRGYFDNAEAVIHNPINKGKNAIVVFADMDGLKSVNDQFGHDDGDYALKSIANILSHSFRTTDIVGRIGGDEFAALALLGGTDNMNNILTRINKTMDSFNEFCEKPYYVNMSVGIYPFICGDDIVLSDILEKADEILYQQKKTKRKSVLKEPKNQ
ncbi:GGDEF domain-containing protein [Ruminococcus sp. HUN007]|uniref:GGDEF domain-containing protein n=1 Tax=Ruminococcus sp. HUN007 TaxID=1514668 RepID=UPI000678DBC7|nr:GGDEF domain-containing protein [Ruminococcus sp. HUN007]